MVDWRKEIKETLVLGIPMAGAQLSQLLMTTTDVALVGRLRGEALAAMAVGQAQAVAMVAAAHNGLEVHGYSPREVKRAVTDHGGSGKEQVQEMVRVLLGLPDEWKETSDATDALAVAICHASASQVLDIIIEE